MLEAYISEKDNFYLNELFVEEERIGNFIVREAGEGFYYRVTCDCGESFDAKILNKEDVLKLECNKCKASPRNMVFKNWGLIRDEKLIGKLFNEVKNRFNCKTINDLFNLVESSISACKLKKELIVFIRNKLNECGEFNWSNEYPWSRYKYIPKDSIFMHPSLLNELNPPLGNRSLGRVYGALQIVRRHSIHLYECECVTCKSIVYYLDSEYESMDETVCRYCCDDGESFVGRKIGKYFILKRLSMNLYICKCTDCKSSVTKRLKDENDCEILAKEECNHLYAQSMIVGSKHGTFKIFEHITDTICRCKCLKCGYEDTITSLDKSPLEERQCIGCN